MTINNFKHLPVGAYICTNSSNMHCSPGAYKQYAIESTGNFPISTIFKVVAEPDDDSIRTHIVIDGVPIPNRSGLNKYCHIPFNNAKHFDIQPYVCENTDVVY